MISWDQEELIGLFVLLSVIIGLSLIGKLSPEAVDGIKWVGGAFLTSKGISGLIPKKT